MSADIKKIDHVGIAVRSVDESCRFYEETLGLKLLSKETVPQEKVRIAIFAVGDSHIELLEPIAPESSIAKFLEKRGEGIHHLALSCDDVKAATEHYKLKGASLIYPEPEEIEDSRIINFIHPKSTGGVLIELIKRLKE